MSDLISREEALAFPFANGKYDHEHANEHFILGCESYKEWLEQLSPVQPQGFEDYLKQYLGENDQMIIGKDVYEELKYKLETLKKSIEQTGWISVKEHGNPTRSDEYWVTVRHATYESVERDYYSTTFGNWYSADEIIAWMEVEPSPYKGE